MIWFEQQHFREGWDSVLVPSQASLKCAGRLAKTDKSVTLSRVDMGGVNLGIYLKYLNFNYFD